LLLWQMGSGPAVQSPSRYLRYERPLSLPLGAVGQACTVLDATVFAHTAATGAGDIRIFGQNAEREFEVPFAFLESSPPTLDTQSATLRNVVVRDGRLSFDLAMPGGEYTDVDLNLGAKNFLGVVQVEGRNDDGRVVPLGSFPIFDLSSEGLARSTVLPLPASIYPLLHVELRLTGLTGAPLMVSASTINGAAVPPSREDQTVYTTIASTSAIEQQGHWSTATMIVPPHVPVERAQFVLKPEFHVDFLRDVTVTATPMQSGLAALGAAEGVSGHIFRVVRNASSSTPSIDSHVLTISTVIGSNLRAPAKVTASVDNGQDQPLPLQRVDLQMRQRELCFEARRETSYTLFYGDADLSAPSYSYAHRFVAAAAPIPATSGPERQNLLYVSRKAEQDKRTPGRDLPWLLAVAAISIAGVTALQFVRHRQEGTR
jgi:hypothetical protein